MNHSPRYQKVKTKIPPHKLYSLPESLNFLQTNNLEKLNNIKVSFSLNQAKQKTSTTLKSKIFLPYPLSPRGKIAVIKDDLLTEIVKNLTKKRTVELLSIKEAHLRIMNEKTNKIKKKISEGSKSY